MNVTEAVASRRSVREFLDKPVDRALLERILTKAQNAPSGGNTQPWNAIMATGEPLKILLEAVAEVVPQGPAAHKPEYNIYPPELDGRYKNSRFGVGEAMYAALDIPRDDKMARLMWFARNFRAFEAPILMLIASNVFMTFAWYGHLKFKSTPLLIAGESSLARPTTLTSATSSRAKLAQLVLSWGLVSCSAGISLSPALGKKCSVWRTVCTKTKTRYKISDIELAKISCDVE